MEIYCCGCEQSVKPKLTDGREIYPHRRDLHNMPYWSCPTCAGYVACHRKTKGPQPVPCIPTAELRRQQREIHRVLDPIWQSGKMSRKALYEMIGASLGGKYHPASLRSVDEAKRAYDIVRDISMRLYSEV